MTEQEVRAVVEQLLSRLNAGELAMPAGSSTHAGAHSCADTGAGRRD